MKYIDFETIRGLGITVEDCIEWVKTSFCHKYECVLPPKISVKLPDDIFINTMPSYIPECNRFGVKVVSRYPNRNPSLQSDLLLYDSVSGNMLALMDGLWITIMRTGAVAALAIKELQKKDACNYAFIGLGNTARATLLCLQSVFPNKEININLLRYKDQAEQFMARFKDVPNLKFHVYDDVETLISGADVVVSCVTVANELFAPDTAYKPGVLVVPVHTRGFQNCDLFFDKVFADDKAHVEGFKYFDKFKKFDELSNVLIGKSLGRESEQERILSYNIGIALHDVYFASKIYERLFPDGGNEEISHLGKFWV